ncbi:aldehyde dehydrogenase [Massilia sp. Root351]|jgi:betaine-aldehyde dehydrogenase|uniref:aldehyde dehydrogenase family protein n=1 Tax=Massilia sp. Root351 TaxID=1736522 RepID=UPI00070FD732|nr:aldehyde dehydrogenase family protein [Massilia sp. Root351]KQV91128.1 aldehyde dehydrogenase [Massilia sp. Root351]
MNNALANQPALHWIDGEWLASDSVRKAHDPATGAVIGQYADGGAREAQLAIAAAQRAFDTGCWAGNAQLRARVLEELAASFERHREALIDLLSLENGKIKRDAGFEIDMAPSKLRFAAALARTDMGRSGSPRPDAVSLLLREPVGVAGIMVPWNSPVILMVRSLAPALAAGATAVIKMPGQTALTNALVARIMSEAPSLPRGVINLFTESGAEGAKLMVASPEVPVISFTGSTRTGQAISAVGAQRLKRFGLELGGKTPHLVFGDADLDAALPVIEKSLTVFSGQFCMTGSRLLVHSSVAGQVRERLAAQLEAVRVGPAADPDSGMGPLIDKANVARVNAAVEQAIASGAKALLRGGPVTEGPLAAGAFYRPTLLEVCDPKLPIVQEETFGPVMTLQVFDTEEEVLALANDSEYGLAAAVWTRDTRRSLRVARKIKAGTVWINDWAQVFDEFEEGGYKQSGSGRLNGVASIDDFLEYKHITFTNL